MNENIRSYFNIKESKFCKCIIHKLHRMTLEPKAKILSISDYGYRSYQI